MKRCLRHFPPAVLLAGILSGSGCGGAASKPTALPAHVTPMAVSDAQFARSLHSLLLRPAHDEASFAVLAGVVRRQFARAAAEFRQGNRARGLQSVRGALYLLRADELRLEMLDRNAADSLKAAYAEVGGEGDEGAALAILRLQLLATPKLDPSHGKAQQHLHALEQWMRDTRSKTRVENSSADAKAYTTHATLEPSAEAIEQARKKINLWIADSIEFSKSFRPGMRDTDREQMIEAYRGVQTGALVLAALYLRYGDASGALKALDAEEISGVAAPEFVERLQRAADGQDAEAWRDLAALYARSLAEGPEQEVAVAAEVARAAAWGTALSAYRTDPKSFEAAAGLAMLLPSLGMADASPLVLQSALQESQSASDLSKSLRFVATVMLQEDEAHAYSSIKSVFASAQPLLALADTMSASATLEPTPRQLRLMMATMHVRHGAIDDAQPILERELKNKPDVQGLKTLASIYLQQRQFAKVLESVDAAMKLAEPGESAVRAEVQLLAFQAHRHLGDIDRAKTALGLALVEAQRGRQEAKSQLARTEAERMVARIALHYRDKGAWSRAVERMFQVAAGDKDAISMALIETTSAAWLLGEPDTARRLLLSTAPVITSENVVYAALWTRFAQRAAKQSEDPQVAHLLKELHDASRWTQALADWSLGTTSDEDLLKVSAQPVEQAEARFYVAANKFVRGDVSGREGLKAVAFGSAIDLVEIHLARELVAQGPSDWGTPPVAFP